MSSLALLFSGKKSKPKSPTFDFSEAIEKNIETTTSLDKKINWLETTKINPNIVEIKRLMKTNRKTDKEKAKKLLIINHKYTDQIKKIQAQLDNLTSIRIAIEGSLMTKNVFDTIKDSTNALKSTMPTIDTVEDIIADTEEAITETNEITEALSMPIQIGMPIDPDDIDAELRELMEEDEDVDNSIDTELMALMNDVSVPTTNLPKVVVPVVPVVPLVHSNVDKEMADLMAFAN